MRIHILATGAPAPLDAHGSGALIDGLSPILPQSIVCTLHWCTIQLSRVMVAAARLRLGALLENLRHESCAQPQRGGPGALWRQVRRSFRRSAPRKIQFGPVQQTFPCGNCAHGRAPAGLLQERRNSLNWLRAATLERGYPRPVVTPFAFRTFTESSRSATALGRAGVPYGSCVLVRCCCC
jgi:hypothetical protein